MTVHRQFRRSFGRRRGFSTPALLISVMTALLVTVMAVDLAQLSIQKHQMQIGANAASLAAVAELMDQRWLYLGPEDSGEDSQTKLQRFENIARLQAATAIEQAESFAALKSVSGQQIVLAGEDIALGWVDDPVDRGATMADQGPDGSWNSIAVQVSRASAGGNPPLLWMARQTGLDQLDIRVRSTAMVDTRLHGFRALAQVRVPLVPLAVFPALQDLELAADPDLPQQLWWAKGPRDEYTVDTKQQTVVEGPDGIAEMVFRLRVDQQNGQQDSSSEDSEMTIRRSAVCKFLPPGPNGSAHQHFADLAYWGLGAEELAMLGGQITLGDDPPAMVPADYQVRTDDLNFIREGLLSIHGLPRIWPVAADVSSALGEPAVGVIGFVAGCVVDCFTDADGCLLIVIQPCLLQTPTALTSEASLRNPWIGKLLLIR